MATFYHAVYFVYFTRESTSDDWELVETTESVVQDWYDVRRKLYYLQNK